MYSTESSFYASSRKFPLRLIGKIKKDTLNTPFPRSITETLGFLQSSLLNINAPHSPYSNSHNTGPLTGSSFDYLPSELIIDIISRTDWRDVTQLRRVSRAFKDLVDTHEHVIVTRWLLPGSYLTLLSQLFYPPRSRSNDGSRRATVQYFYGLERRHVTCSQLAYYLCDKALTPMFRPEFTLDRRAKKEMEIKKDQAIRAVQRRLTKQLYFFRFHCCLFLFLIGVKAYMGCVQVLCKRYFQKIFVFIPTSWSYPSSYYHTSFITAQHELASYPPIP